MTKLRTRMTVVEVGLEHSSARHFVKLCTSKQDDDAIQCTGDLRIEVTPEWVKAFAKSLYGTVVIEFEVPL